MILSFTWKNTTRNTVLSLPYSNYETPFPLYGRQSKSMLNQDASIFQKIASFCSLISETKTRATSTCATFGPISKSLHWIYGELLNIVISSTIWIKQATSFMRDGGMLQVCSACFVKLPRYPNNRVCFDTCSSLFSSRLVLADRRSALFWGYRIPAWSL